jgi:hypothetical protein
MVRSESAPTVAHSPHFHGLPRQSSHNEEFICWSAQKIAAALPQKNSDPGWRVANPDR